MILRCSFLGPITSVWILIELHVSFEALGNLNLSFITLSCKSGRMVIIPTSTWIKCVLAASSQIAIYDWSLVFTVCSPNHLPCTKPIYGEHHTGSLANSCHVGALYLHQAFKWLQLFWLFHINGFIGYDNFSHPWDFC